MSTMAALSAGRLVRFLVLFTSFTSCFQLILTREFVPVFVWGSTSAAASGANIPALTRIGSGKFGKILGKTLQFKSAVVVFVEEKLSVEDFSRRDASGRGYFPKLQELSASSQGISYLSSVRSPVRVISDWSNKWKHCTVYPHGLIPEVNLKNNIQLIVHFLGPPPGEPRSAMLRRHDSVMSDIYEELLEKSDDVIALYTAEHPSWVEDAPRPVAVELRVRQDRTHFYNGNNRIYLYTGALPHLVIKGENVTLSMPSSVTAEPGPNTRQSTLIVKYPGSPAVTIRFNFRGKLPENWTLKNVDVIRGGANYSLATRGVEAPLGCCYRSGKMVVFRDPRRDDTSLTFYNIQVQPELQQQGNTTEPPKFGKTSGEHFVTAPIASGLLVVTLFLGVVCCAVYMLMDLKTVDRFDDPKGKTITVNMLT